MSPEPNNLSDGADGLPLVMSAGALIRAGADGELPSSGSVKQTADLARVLTGSGGVEDPAARVEFERSLRIACGRSMNESAGTASAALRERVESAMRGEVSGPTPWSSGEDRERAAAGVVSHGARHEAGRAVPGRIPMSRGRRWAMSAGASAILVFAGLAVYQAVINSGAAVNPAESFTAQLASFVRDEHDRTAVDTPAARAKFGCTDFTRICTDFTPTLGESPALPTLGGAEDLAFQGAAPCGVPGGGASVHLRFYTRRHEGGHDHQISLFVQRGTNRLDLEDGRVYTIECPRASVWVWRNGTLVYYLVSDDRDGCECFRSAVGVGEPTEVARAK